MAISKTHHFEGVVFSLAFVFLVLYITTCDFSVLSSLNILFFIVHVLVLSVFITLSNLIKFYPIYQVILCQWASFEQIIYIHLHNCYTRWAGSCLILMCSMFIHWSVLLQFYYSFSTLQSGIQVSILHTGIQGVLLPCAKCSR